MGLLQEFTERIKHVVAGASLLWLSIVIINAVLIWLIAVAVYRLYFHPLAKYPGPWYMKISPIYDFYIGLKERRHLHFQYLHDKYGNLTELLEKLLAYRECRSYRSLWS